MLKISEVISKPVYSLYEGVKTGTVKNFLYDSRTKKIKGFFIFDDESEGHDQFIATKNIFVLSEDYMLIRNKSKMQTLIPEEQNIIGLKTIMIGGDDAGQVTDLYFDKKYKVQSFETHKGVIFPITIIAKIGEDAIILDAGEKRIRISRMKPYNRIIAGDLPEIKVNILEEGTLSTIPMISGTIPQERIKQDKPAQKNRISLPTRVLSNPKSIIGKQSNKLIYGMNGEIIVRNGQIITEKLYEKAKKHLKLFELTNSVN